MWKRGQHELFYFLDRSDSDLHDPFTMFHILKDGISLHVLSNKEIFSTHNNLLEILFGACQLGFLPNVNTTRVEESKLNS